jgi:hypothetical protein
MQIEVEQTKQEYIVTNGDKRYSRITIDNGKPYWKEIISHADIRDIFRNTEEYKQLEDEFQKIMNERK